MKLKIFTAIALGLSLGAVHAESLNSAPDSAKQNSPGTTGALGNVNRDGVATDPGGVRQQQGDAAKSAPGTVGAAPGTTPPATGK